MNAERFSSTSCLWILAFLFFSSLAEGGHQVIGSVGPIVGAPGADVILPCRVEPELNVETLTIEWSMPDPGDPLSQVGIVYVYRDRRELLDMTMPAFENRTHLFPDNLKRGDISLKIKNVTVRDEGRYKCYIPRLDGRNEGIVDLVIEPTLNSWTTETPLRPTEVQTPGLTEEMDRNGDPRRHFGLMASLLLVSVCLSVAAVLLIRRERVKQPDVSKGTASHSGALLKSTLLAC